MKMYICGQWVDRDDKMPVINPFDQSPFDTVPRGSAGDVQAAIASAVRGAAVMGRLPAHRRYAILQRAAELMAARAADLAETITREEGKVIAEGRAEVQRAIQTITLSAEEAKRLHGETVPLDAMPGVVSQFGFTIRVPVGVVAAIAPFNFPLNLVCHKVGPASGRRQRRHPEAGRRHAAVRPEAHRAAAGSRPARRSHSDYHRLRRRNRRRHHRLAPGTQDYLHGQHGSGRPHLPQCRHQKGNHGTGLQQPPHHYVRRRH